MLFLPMNKDHSEVALFSPGIICYSLCDTFICSPVVREKKEHGNEMLTEDDLLHLLISSEMFFFYCAPTRPEHFFLFCLLYPYARKTLKLACGIQNILFTQKTRTS